MVAPKSSPSLCGTSSLNNAPICDAAPFHGPDILSG